MMPVSRLVLLVASGASLLAGCAVPGQLRDRFAAGRNAEGEGCTASRDWKAADLTDAFDAAYAIACEGVEASRPVATVSRVPASKRLPEPEGDCGEATSVTLPGIGPAMARRCYDKVLQASAVVVRFSRGKQSYRGASEATAAGPMTRTLAALATGIAPDASRDSPSPINAAALAPAPAPRPGFSEPGENRFNVDRALRQGIALNWQGLNVEASRVLNDAISRLTPEMPMSAQIELQLEAGLADSKIRFNEAAADHFKRAEVLLAANPTISDVARLERKRSTYRAIDSINRRDWNGAISALATNADQFPLEDVAVLADLNQGERGDAAIAVTAANAAQLEQLVVDAQRSWAASVAFLSRGDDAGDKTGTAALDRAITNVTVLLNSRVDPASVAWLAAQIERQSGRLVARRGDRAGGAARDPDDFRLAVGRFDCALAALTGQRPTEEGACAIKLTPAARGRLVAAARISGPVIAETELERASIAARGGAPVPEVIDAYNEAVEGLIATGRAGSLAPSGLESYLDLLAEDNAKDPSGPSAERFFRAVQAVGEPSIARQLSELQAAIAAGNPEATRLLREKADLRRDLAGLRYQVADAAIASSQSGAPDVAQQKAALAAREAEREAKEQRLREIDDALLADGRLRAINDAPATIADLQATLEPDEVYFKLVEIRGHTYGMVIDKARVQVYNIAALSPRLLAELAARVRRSIRDNSGKLPFYDVGASNALFQLITGPAQGQLLAARSVIVDPGGPLGDLPAGVLVIDKASVASYAASRAANPNDYSGVSFLAGHANLSTALSPRSFIETRALARSRAPNPLIGLGQHAPAPEGQALSAAVRVGLGCLVNQSELARISRINPPISATKLEVVAQALGFPNAPEIIGPAFSDTGIEARTDLDQYQVLHFATHGLPETELGCATIPPALLTSIGPGESDGFLSFAEISGLKLDANLVVLSACETAASASQETGRRSGQEESGRSLDGLVRAFLAANARAVVATYWQVSTAQESDQLMQSFYQHGRVASIGSALRTAQTDLMKTARYSHPYYWGAYFVVGDASKQMLSGAVAAQPATTGEAPGG